MLPILDPKTHTATTFPAPVRDADTPEGWDGPRRDGDAARALGLLGQGEDLDTKVNNHNSMIDRKAVSGRRRVRGPENPDFCKKGSDHPSAKLFPLKNAPGTRDARSQDDEYTPSYDTCFQTIT